MLHKTHECLGPIDTDQEQAAMATIGYRRVSSEDQSNDRQDLGACDKVFEEKASAATRNREALSELLEWVRDNDLVVVHSIDRLARNLVDLLEIVTVLRKKGASITFLKENLTFSPSSNDPASTFYLQILGAVAQFERAIIKERQKEGIAKAKQKGVYKGRKPSLDKEQILSLKAQGASPTDISKKMNISRMSVYRTLKG